MAQETYHIPKEPTSFFHFQNDAIGLCTPNATAWNIPPDTLPALLVLQAAYLSAYTVASNKATRSEANTNAREAAQEAFSASLDTLYRKYLINNDAIDIDDKTALHIHHKASGGGRPAPAPNTTPVVQLISEGISQLYVVYADAATPGKHHKPHNVAFAELWYKVGDPTPGFPNDCPERFNATRSHEPIIFEPSERGKTCYGFARWVNKNGKTGPWSNVFEAMIP